MKTFLSLVLLAHGASALAHAKTWYGPKVSVGYGHARSFVKMNHGKLQEIGISVSHRALYGLPHDEMKDYVLPLPGGVSVPDFKHLTLDWNPHGHEPDHVYTKPHFDFHFYYITNAERQAISCMGADAPVCTKMPEADALASHYGATPAGVPMMGWHWVDLLSPEFNGGEFTRTYIYGYYNGVPTFVEPMVTMDYLMSKHTSVKNVRTPAKFPYSGSWPGQYKVWFDRVARAHKIVLRKF